MPNSTAKMGIALGVSRGVNAFVQSYQQAKTYELHRKMTQNQPAIDALLSIIKNPGSKYSEIANAMDAIPGLTGAPPTSQTLSQQTGLRQLLDKQVLTDEATPGTAATQGRTLSDQGGQTQGTTETAAAPNRAVTGTGELAKQPVTQQIIPNQGNYASTTAGPSGDLQLKGQAATSAVPAGYTSYGDLSPDREKVLEERGTIETQQQAQYNRQAALLATEIKLRTDAAMKTGYTIPQFKGVDPATGHYTVIMGNAAGQHITNDYGVLDPDTLRIATLRGMGKPSVAFENQKRSYLIGNDPATGNPYINPLTGDRYTDSEASAAAATDTAKAFDLSQKLKAALTTSAGQKIAGTTPPTQAQVVDDEARLDQRQDTMQGLVDDLRTKGIEASRNSAEAAQAAHDYQTGTIQPLKDQMNQWLGPTQKGSVTDPEYKAFQGQLNAATREYEGLAAKARTAAAADQGYKSHLTDAQKRLDDFITRRGSGKLGGNAGRAATTAPAAPTTPTKKSKISARDQQLIAQFKHDNPNTPLDDDGILVILRKNKIR